jgi:hypothetical protein
MHPLLSFPSIQSYSLIVRGTPDKVKLTRPYACRRAEAHVFPCQQHTNAQNCFRPASRGH